MLADVRVFAGRPAFCWLAAAGVTNAMATTGVGMFLISYLLRVYGLPLTEAGMWLGIMAAFGVAGALSGGWIADFWATRTPSSYLLVAGIGAALSGALYLLAFLNRDWTIAVIGLLIGHLTADLKNGPTYAAVQNLSPPNLRAMGSALFMLGTSAIGAGLGPLLVGFISDVAAASAFTAGPAFSAACPGGKAPSDASQWMAQACATASASGLQTALITACCIFFFAATFFLLGARSMGKGENG